MNTLILATDNDGKIAELGALLYPMRCIAQARLGITAVEETGLTFIENALIKARHASREGKGPALADDSGLVVPALGGAPGLYSSRFAARVGSSLDNSLYLLEQLKDVPVEARQAYFYCVIVMLLHAEDPTPLIAIGQWHGVIAEAPSGKAGFGYDPVFYVPAHQCTAAELPAVVKNSMSHRGQALKQLREQL